MTEQWTFTWRAGPDCGATVVIGQGSHVIGRAVGAAVRCDDSAIELHHLLVEVSTSGATVCQLTGRTPARLDGAALAEAVTVTAPAQLEIGHSLLSMVPGDLTAPAQDACAAAANIVTTPHGEVVVRSPRSPALWSPSAVSPATEPPMHGESTGGILPALLALGGAGLLAVLVHQPMFLLFGAIGAVAAFGTWGGHHLTSWRRRRRDLRASRASVARFDREVSEQRVAFVGHLLASTPTPASAHRTIGDRTADLWARRSAHPDGLAASIGLGPVAWSPHVIDTPGRSGNGGLEGMTSIADLPLVADLGAACRLAVRGRPSQTAAVARSLVLQIAANCGPADVRFIVVTHEPARWRWLHSLPHACTSAGLVAVVTEAELFDTVAELEAAPHPHLIVITDSADLLAPRTGPLRRAAGADRSMGLIVLIDDDGGVPHVCTSLLDLRGPVFAGWHADAALDSLPVQVRWFGIGERSATRLAARFAGLVDPEDSLGGGAGIPREVTLLSLLPSLDPAAIAAAWLSGGADPPPRALIGVAGDGVVDLDLDRDGPHALLAGTTGSGKSELLRTLVAALAIGSSPDHINFVLVDYKGGSTFDACADLPHVVGVVTDLDQHLADRALRSLHAELRRREQLFRDVAAGDLASFRRAAPDAVLPRLVVIIDEFASLVGEQPDFLHALVGIAQRGRSLGVHLVLATQRPSGVISDDIRANTNLRLALRLHDASDALDVVGDHAPATISRGLAGRAVMRLGPDELLTFQTARCTAPLTTAQTELDHVVAAVGDAAALIGVRRAASPWLAPLPTQVPVDGGAVAEGIVGVIDDPDHQRMVPLRWDRGGNLLLVGVAGSGVTSALVLLGSAALADGRGTHVYVIDGRGDQALRTLERSPNCAGVVRTSERERLIRLVNRLAGEIDERSANPSASRPPIVVLVDGLDVLRTALDDLDTSAELELLDTILATGAAHDVVTVCAVDRVAALPSAVVARCPIRWIFHLTDPLDASAWGVPAADVPASIHGRIVVASSRLQAQLMVGPVSLPVTVSGPLPPAVECLAASLDAAALPAAHQSGEDSCLPIGRRFDDGRVATLEVPDGEHVLIIGPARSGRSTALQRIVRGWRDAHPNGWSRIVAPRRSCLDTENPHRSLADLIDDIPDTGRVLLAVDDAELVDDIGGALAALAASRRHGLLIVATGKPDALRHTYGHWTTVVRRSRLGLVASAANDLDGDLLGAMLPRRTPIPARPGLAWLVRDGDFTLTQVAVDHAAALAVESSFARR